MPLGAAAVLPQPPLLVPELGGLAAPELDPLRAACRSALTAAAAASDGLVLVGDGPVWGVAMPAASASFAPWGAPVRVRLDLAAPPPSFPGLPEPVALDELPLALAVAAWALDGLPIRPVAAVTVPSWVTPADAAAAGRAIVEGAGAIRRLGVVAIADGSARRGERAPGGPHPDAEAFDARIAAALRAGDLPALLTLDPTTCAELMVGGRAPLQVLAGAFAGHHVAGRLLYDAAPYGVGYLVAVCTPDAA
jgi:hypothetical protein